MNKPRQDAWTKDEDLLLTEIVLRYIRAGNTQLEAFKEAADRLSRTPGACGFRWNATLRKKHLEAIHVAKKSRKQQFVSPDVRTNEEESLSIESAISLLEKIKQSVEPQTTKKAKEHIMYRLEQENDRLKNEVKRYQEAWAEMKNIWDWIENKNEH